MKIRTIASNRKDIVAAISEVTNTKAVYLGPPTFGYKIGEFTVDREGMVEILNQDIGETIKEELVQRGLAEDDAYNLELNVPVEFHTGASLRNLVFMIHSKQYLINKAIGRQVFKVSETLISKLEEKETETIEDFKKIFEESGGSDSNYGVAFTDENILFNGFPMDSERIKAFVELATLMSSAAINHKRVSPKETIEENEKYYMRVWLVRLGLGGQGGKETRRILLQKLNGHTAFRTEEEKERAKERNKIRKENSEE